MNRKGWRPAWFLSVLLALSIAFAATQVCRVKALENQVGAEYQRAFYETVELVEGMESDLEKLMVTASGAQEQKRLLRSLMNVRAPMAADETFLAVQDDYLRRELDARGVVRLSDLRPLCSDLYLW